MANYKLLLVNTILLLSYTCRSQSTSSSTPSWKPPNQQYFPWWQYFLSAKKPTYVPPPPPSPPPPPVPNYSDSLNNPAKPVQPGYGDYWEGWTNLGGAFRMNPIAIADPSGYQDLVLAINRQGMIKAKTYSPTQTSKWVTIFDSRIPTYPMGDIAAVLNSGSLYIYAINYADGRLYELPFPLNTSPLSVPSPAPTPAPAWTAVGTLTYVGTPAVVAASNGNRYVFGIRSTDGKIYPSRRVTSAATSSNSIPSGPTEGFVFSPVAATYNGYNGQRIVVAAVGGRGDLYIADDTAANYDLVFSNTAGQASWSGIDITCIEQPVAVSLGNAVEVYCRTGDMAFYCVTIQSGGDVDYRLLQNEELPRYFSAAPLGTSSSSVYIYSRASDGRVLVKWYK